VSSNYTMPIAAGKTVTFTISGGTGDADMYVRAGAAPTTTRTTAVRTASGNAETCTFTADHGDDVLRQRARLRGLLGRHLEGHLELMRFT
jgi:hypothetical protein